MTYEPKNYDRLLGSAGLSDALLKNHFTLYQGYVKNTNLSAFINLLDWSKAEKRFETRLS